MLAVVVNRHAFVVDINTNATVLSSQQGQLYDAAVANIHDYYSTGSDLNVILSILTLLVYVPVGTAGGSYHKLGSKHAALLVRTSPDFVAPLVRCQAYPTFHSLYAFCWHTVDLHSTWLVL